MIVRTKFLSPLRVNQAGRSLQRGSRTPWRPGDRR